MFIIMMTTFNLLLIKYSGDTVKSVMTDLCFCGLGYFTGAVFLSLEMVWLSGVWIAASEVNLYFVV